MRTINRILVYSIVSLIIVGCSILPKIDEDTLPTNARVGVVSLIYNDMDFVKLSGIPIYSYHDESHNVFDWKMDRYVQSSVSKKLKQRFNIINITYNTAKLKKGFNNKNPYTGLPMFYISSDEIKKEFKRIDTEFGYALSHDRPVDQAIEEDLKRELDKCEGTGEIDKEKIECKVHHFEPDSSLMKSLVECYCELSEENGILVELILSPNHEIFTLRTSQAIKTHRRNERHNNQGSCQLSLRKLD